MINSRVIKFLESLHIITNKKVFLQHGITMNTLEWAFKDLASINLFCCSAVSELDFIKKRFGYEDDKLVLTGLCRFDNLYRLIQENKYY